MDNKLPNIDLGKTQITDKLRVSSAGIFYEAHFGDYYQLETWIFSEDKSVMRSQQIIHCTTERRIPQKRIDEVKRIHKQIADNLLIKFKPGFLLATHDEGLGATIIEGK